MKVSQHSFVIAQGGNGQDVYNMQAMARALSDNYTPADLQPLFDGPPDSRAGSNGGSLFGSLQSDGPAMNSPFNAVCSVPRPSIRLAVMAEGVRIDTLSDHAYVDISQCRTLASSPPAVCPTHCRRRSGRGLSAAS